MEWDAVTWSLAEQVAELVALSEKGQALLTAGLGPSEFFDKLRAAGALDDAAGFLAVALPRRLAISWARDCVAHTAREAKLKQPALLALSAVGAWLDDPSEERRWTAHDAANNAGMDGPEALLAMAVFLSGGSISPPGTPQPVPAPPELTGKLAGGAVLLAAVRVQPQLIADTKLAFLDRGVKYAIGDAG